MTVPITDWWVPRPQLKTGARIYVMANGVEYGPLTLTRDGVPKAIVLPTVELLY